MPLNRIRQFETFCGKAFVSEYLCIAQGDKVVVTIPSGKKASVLELAQVQGAFADAMSRLVRFYESGGEVEETASAITATLVQLAYQRENVLKAGTPELDLFEGDE